MFDVNRCTLKFMLSYSSVAEISKARGKIQSLSCRTKHVVRSALANNNSTLLLKPYKFKGKCCSSSTPQMKKYVYFVFIALRPKKK